MHTFFSRCCLSAILLAAQSVLGGDLFIKFSEYPTGFPVTPGESTSTGRAGWTDISSFQSGAFRSVGIGSIGERELSNVGMSGVYFTKIFDSLSPVLFSTMTQAAIFGKAEIEFEIFDGKQRISPFSITLNEVQVDSMSWATSSGSPAIYESFSLFFSSASILTLKKNPDGSYTEGLGYLAYFDQSTQSGTYEEVGSVPPVIDSVPGQTVPRNEAGHSFSFSFSDTDNEVDTLIVDAASLNDGLIPDVSINLTGTGGSRTVQYSTADNIGTATIRLSVDDGTHLITRDVTVNVVNPQVPPTLVGPVILAGCIEEPNPFTGIAIAGPDTGRAYQLNLVVNHGALTLATDIPGGVVPGDISDNGTGTVVITSSLNQINTTLADPFGLLFGTVNNASAELLINLNDTDPGNTLFDSLTIPVEVYADPFVCWQVGFFSEEEIAGNLNTGELDDFDGDGILNLIEWATGLDPLNPGDLIPMTVTISKEGEDSFLNVTYRRRTTASTVSYSLELYDPNTMSWLDGTAEVLQVGGPETVNPLIESVSFKVTDPLIGPATIVRLKVLRIP